MEYDPKQITDRFEGIAKSSLQEVHSQWWEQYKYNTNRIKSVLNSLKVDLAQIDKWKANPERFWSDMRLLISRKQQWLRSLHILEKDISFNQLTSDFLEKFDKEVQLLPAEIRILIGDFYWQIKPEDKFFVKLRKRMRPIKYSLQGIHLKSRNLIRGVLQKPPVKKQSDERIIKLQDFLAIYLALPVCHYIKDEWLHYLQAILGQYFIVQGKSTELLKNMLMLERTEKLINSEKENIFNTLYMMAEILKEIDIAFESINDYEKQLLYRFDKFWHDMINNFSSSWDRAGTFQLPNKKYSPEEYKIKKYKLENRYKRDLQWWQKQVDGLLGEWQKNLNLTQLGLNSSVAILQTAHIFDTNISDKIKPELISTRHQIDQMILRIDETKNAKDLKSYYDQKLKEFSRVKFSQLLDTASTAQLPLLISRALDTINLFQNEIMQSVVIFIHRDTSNLPPRSKVRSIGLNKLVEYFAYRPCEESCKTLYGDISEKQDEIYRNISQLGRMIEFKFESAIQLIAEHDLDERVDEAKLIIRDTLAQAEQQITDIIKEIVDIHESVKRILPEKLNIFCTKLVHLFSSENLIWENIQLVKAQKKHTRSIFLTRAINFTKNLLLNIVNIPWKYLIYVLNTYFIHSSVEKESEKTIPVQDSVSRFLRETSDKISQLPYIYRKLFLFSPLTSSRFYSARKAEFKDLREEFSRWHNGEPGMIALIGEMGSGKTTLLNMAKNEIFEPLSTIYMDTEETVTDEKELCTFLANHFGSRKTNSLKSLRQTVENKSTQMVCILENLNLLFAKSVTGMNLLEQLLGFMIQTQTQIFWVVTCSSYSWQYLRKTIKAEKYFQRIINLGEFSNGDIKAIIVNRHRLSGYDLLFESNGNLVQNKKLNKLQSEDHRQDFLNKQYFHKLNKISTGNVSVAMLYWLRSINAIQDDKVVLNASIDFDYEFLKNLSQIELFTLAAIVNFEKISVSDHAHLFNQSVDQSDLHLNQMCRYGILVQENDKYLIHPFLYRHLVELLKSKNILH